MEFIATLKRGRLIAHVTGLSMLAMIALIQPAHAYIDPGTASIILQAVIGAIAVTGLFFRATIARALRFLRIGKAKPATETDPGRAGPGTNNADGA